MQASVAINPALLNLSVAQQRQPLKAVVLGDSIVYGFGDTEGGGWVDYTLRVGRRSSDRGVQREHRLVDLGVHLCGLANGGS